MEAKSMASKTKEVNRSAEIRAVLSKSPNLSASEVVEKLAKNGITVTVPLVYKVKKMMKKAGREVVAEEVANTAPAATTTANGDVNQSEEIRTVLAANPKMNAKTVVEELAKKGVTVSTASVYNVKSTLSKRKQKRKAASTNGHIAANGHATNGATLRSPIQLVLKVKDLATELGGWNPSGAPKIS